ncbi:MAG TPA: zf-HC2 domain-containing protein [Acidimicrobiales bacterium]|nr:zf-HC2 domain-containing protein [Acidimicrobiales bacterium]
MTTGGSGCGRFADDLAELALGTLTGRERAELLGHLEGCPRCTEEVEGLSAAADSLLLAVPEAEPPVGFEVRVLDRLAAARRDPSVPRLGARRRGGRRWAGPAGAPRTRSARRLVASAAAAALLAASVGFGIGRATGGGGRSNAAPGVALNGNVVEASLLSAGHARGVVYVDEGDPGWLFMTVERMGSVGPVTCEVTTASGHTVMLGTFWLQSGHGAWASQLPGNLGPLRSARVRASDGTVLASASLSV